MIISRECDYAVRIIRALMSSEIQPVQEICQTEQIPVQYAYKILKKLTKSGLIKSHRGRQGGYQLETKLEDITLYDIMVAINDDLFINACMKPGYDCPLNPDGNQCGVHKEFCRIQEQIINILQEKSISEIIATTTI
ncbi:MAG: Rrf2 family transcriptional regulator [Oscillospiraceae bacterium]|nr:Rrf2 family transcriptional regulator [Oscillospiraceae bacterium]